MYMIQSRQAAALRLEQILRKFDKHSAEGYDIKDIAHLEADLRDLLVSKLSQNSNKNFSEAKFGSERTTVFLEALKLQFRLYHQINYHIKFKKLKVEI